MTGAFVMLRPLVPSTGTVLMDGGVGPERMEGEEVQMVGLATLGEFCIKGDRKMGVRMI